jgi:hypothetical protein
MSDSSRSQILWSPETVFNEVPSSPVMTKLRFGKEALKHKNSTVTSAEIRPDRMRSDLLLVGVDVDGTIDSEFSYLAFDTFIQAGLCGTWTNLTSSVVDGVTTSSSPNISSATAAFTPSDVGKQVSGVGIPAGTYILSYASATAVVMSANATGAGTGVTFYFSGRKVTDLATSNVAATITSLTAAFTAADVGSPISGAGITPGTTILSVQSGTAATMSANGTTLATGVTAQFGYRGQILKNGVLNRSFLVEKGYLDINQFVQFRGTAIEEWNLDISSRKVIAQSIAFMGAQATRSGTTVSGSSVAAPTYPPITAGPMITGIETNTNMTGIKVNSFKLQVKNNMRIHDHVEALASDDFGRGVQDITGSLTAYFKSGALYDQFLANGAISFQFVIADPLSGKAYTIQIPVMKLPDVGQEIPGVDADVIQNVTWRGLYDSVSGAHMIITR